MVGLSWIYLIGSIQGGQSGDKLIRVMQSLSATLIKGVLDLLCSIKLVLCMDEMSRSYCTCDWDTHARMNIWI